MKKILTITGIIILYTIATTSVAIALFASFYNKKPITPIVTNPPVQKSNNIKLNEQVAKDLGLIDNNNKSLVKTDIFIDSFAVHWRTFNSNSKKYVKTINLLNFDDTPVSQASEKFLVETLKCTKDNQGKFNRDEVTNIHFLFYKVNPIISKKRDGSDYEVTGGTFKFTFIKGTEMLGNYTMNLAISNWELVKYVLDNFSLVYTDFKSIPDFEARKDNNKPKDGTDLYENIKHDGAYKKLELLNRFFNKGDEIKIIVTGRETTPNNSHWEKGNSLKVKIHFGTIISKEYSLILP